MKNTIKTEKYLEEYKFSTRVENALKEKINIKDNFHHWVRKLCYANYEFVEYLEKEHEQVRHYLAYIKIGLESYSDNNITDVELTKIIINQKKIKVLKYIYKSYPSGLDKVISKTVGAQPMNYYQGIVNVLSLKGNNKHKRILWCADNINYTLLFNFFELNKELRHLPLVYNLHVNEVCLLNYIIDLVKSYIPEEQHDEVITSLRKYKNMTYIVPWCFKWLKKAKFNQAPWAGDNLAKPITTGSELMKQSRRMKNCMKNYIIPILEGKHYFYTWEGSLKAVVHIINRPMYGWIIDDIYGYNNKKLDDKYKTTIENHFAKIGINKLKDYKFTNIVKAFHNELREYQGHFDDVFYDMDALIP